MTGGFHGSNECPNESRFRSLSLCHGISLCCLGWSQTHDLPALVCSGNIADVLGHTWLRSLWNNLSLLKVLLSHYLICCTDRISYAFLAPQSFKATLPISSTESKSYLLLKKSGTSSPRNYQLPIDPQVGSLVRSSPFHVGTLITLTVYGSYVCSHSHHELKCII